VSIESRVIKKVLRIILLLRPFDHKSYKIGKFAFRFILREVRVCNLIVYVITNRL